MMRKQRGVIKAAFIMAMAGTLALLGDVARVTATVSIDQLDDLTAGVIPVVTLTERNNFDNEFRYDVTVQNRTSHPIFTDSLLIVVDQIVDLAGKDATNRIEVIGPDGQTPAGKPYYKVPMASKGQLAPYSESEPATVRLRNPYYTVVFEPSFRVLGRQVREPPSTLLTTTSPTASKTEADKEDPTKRLVDILIKKGVFTQEEWTEVK